MNNQIHEKPRYICADIKNILLGVAALVAASGYGLKTYTETVTMSRVELRQGYWFAVQVEKQKAAEAKAKWEEEHKEEVEAKKAEEKAKAEAERDERETALVDKVIERRNAQLKAIADKASKGAK